MKLNCNNNYEYKKKKMYYNDHKIQYFYYSAFNTLEICENGKIFYIESSLRIRCILYFNIFYFWFIIYILYLYIMFIINCSYISLFWIYIYIFTRTGNLTNISLSISKGNALQQNKIICFHQCPEGGKTECPGLQNFK